jgi:hypothetical protein
MRVLIDECIDERFRNSLPEHDCQTARYAGLAGLKNGELIAAEKARFEVFLTVDQGIEYQQNLTGRCIDYCSGEQNGYRSNPHRDLDLGIVRSKGRFRRVKSIQPERSFSTVGILSCFLTSVARASCQSGRRLEAKSRKARTRLGVGEQQSGPLHPARRP